MTEICRPATHSSSKSWSHTQSCYQEQASRKVAYAVCILMQLRILKLNRKLVANDQPVFHGPPACILRITISQHIILEISCQTLMSRESLPLRGCSLRLQLLYFFVRTERIGNMLFWTLAFPLRHVFCIIFSFNKNLAVKRKTCGFKGTSFSDCRKNYLGLVSCKWLLASWYSSFVNLDWKFCSNQLLKRWSV